jgi:hypothetical protein
VQKDREPMSTGGRRLTFKEGIILGVLVEDPNIEHHTPAYIAQVTGFSLDDVLATLDELERGEYVNNIPAGERARNN